MGTCKIQSDCSGVIISKDGKSDKNISNKIAQETRVMRRLNSVLWNDKLMNETKVTWKLSCNLNSRMELRNENDKKRQG